MKFIHLTDTHLIAGGGDLYGTNPQLRLEQAVAHILEHQADANAVVITGDLTHLGHPDAYTRLCECLSHLPMPVYLILGNHDGRDVFKKFFPNVQLDPNGFVQYTQEFSGYQAIFLDTHQPGAHWGVFCEHRAEWLRKQLDSSAMPVLLFMHHPFFPVGIRSMDSLALRDAGPFLEAINGHEQRIRNIFMGHIHRPIFGSFRGIPFSILRGTNHQVALSINSNEPDILGSQEPPQYGVVLINDEQVVIHVEDYLDTSKRFYLGAFQKD